jgi:hypothetical protein
MINATQFEGRASRSRSQHEGESSYALCDRPSRTRDFSQRQLPTDQDYAVSTREYQTDQSSLKTAPAAAGPAFEQQQKQQQKQKQPHRCAGIDRVTPYQSILTSYFWRSIENMAINPAQDTAQEAGANVLLWGVSQAAPVRRMQINGGLELTNSWCGNASGGFISDTVVTGQVNSCSQQQWYTRNSNLGSWTGSNWNMVFSGVEGAPVADYPPVSGNGATNADTVLTNTPVSREKPFLYVDASGNYNLFVPTVLTNSSGVSWSATSMGTGYSIQITNGASLTGNVLIASPTTPLATINAALAAGESLILTPGVYGYAGSINVTKKNTVILGLGYATLVPQAGTAAITVADVDGVQIAGLLIDAGPVNSPVLLQVGVAGSARADHTANPSSINDVDIRIGGAEVGTATTGIEIDSNNVILDGIWSWRADHGAGAGWTTNPSKHGLIVNADNVTALGLAVEHYQQEQVLWNGNNGETIFYQSELPYDPPSQAAWMDGGNAGYPSYVVTEGVQNHQAYGLGVYSYFNLGVNIVDTSAISVPNAPGVSVTDAVSVFLNGSGSITYTVNNAGTAVQSGAMTSYVPSYTYTPCTANCPVAPSPASGLKATTASTSQINLSWTASPTVGVAYNIYRSLTSGFTPSDSYIVGANVNGTSFQDAGLTGATTFYYAVEAVNSVGLSAPTTLASATTFSNTVCNEAPTLPATVLSEAISSSQNLVTWEASEAPPVCNVTYTIYRGRNASAGAFAPPMQVATGLKVSSYTDTGLTNPSTYYYTVKAVDAAGSSSLTNGQQSTPLAANWSLAWGDDFTGSANSNYNTANWTPDVVNNTGNNPFGDGTIMSTTDSLQNAYLDGNGDLVVAMTYNAASSAYDSARLISNSPVGPYGRIEARIMNPAATGMGAAFWALGSNYWSTTNPVAWPKCGELDMMEAQAANPGQGGSTIHGYETDSGTNYEYNGLSVSYSLPAGQTFDQAFHTYAVQWAPYHIQYFLDGVQYGDVSMADLSAADIWPMNESINFILSSGVGGNGGTPNGIGYPSNLTFDYIHYYQWAAGVPSPVTGLTATANFSNAVNLSWTASASSGVTYNVYASTASGVAPSVATLVAEQVSGTTYQHTGLQPGTTYYYTVVASNWGGESAVAKATATTKAAGNSTGLQLSAGGYAVGTYMASNFVVGGSTNYHMGNAVNTSLVTNPAPQLVYDTERWGPAAWTITGLTPGAGYNVRLHFVEATHNASGQRAFNVSINSQNALTNFDVFHAAGAMNKAVTQEFYTLADESGIIELQTTLGTNGDGDLNPTISAIEIIPATTTTAASAAIGAASGAMVDLAINSGGSVAGDFVTDEDFNGGTAATSTNTITIGAGTTAAAPALPFI